MKISFIFISLLFLFSQINGIAQSEYQLIRHITTEDGLPSNNVYSVAEDSKGFLWFATDDGVVKFDGEQMKIFTTADGLPKNDIFDLKEDSRGRMWLMCNCNKIVYVKNDSIYQTHSKINKFYFSDFMENEEGILLTNQFHFLQEKGDSLKFSDRLDKNSQTIWGSIGEDTLFFAQYVNGKLKAKSEKVKLENARTLMLNRTYYHKDFVAFMHLKSESIYVYNLASNTIETIHIEKTGNRKNYTSKLRARGLGYDYVTNGQLYKIDPYELAYENVGLNAFEYCEFPTSFIETETILALSSLDNGLHLFRKNKLETNKILLTNEVSAFEIVQDSLLLIGDKKGNLSLTNKNLETLSTLRTQGFIADSEIRRIYFDDSLKQIHLQSRARNFSKLSIVNEGMNLKSTVSKNDILPGYRDFIFKNRDTVLLRSSNGIDLVHNLSGKRTNLSLCHANDFKLSADKNTLYIGGNQILLTYDFIRKTTDTLNLDYNIRTIVEIDDLLFVGTDGQGIFCIDLDTEITKNILPNKSVRDLTVSDQHIIVSTSQGAIFLNKESPHKIKKYFRRSEGLLSNEVKFSTTFQDKYLFITRDGVQLIDTFSTNTHYDVKIYLDNPKFNISDTIHIPSTREFSFQINKIDYVNYPVDYFVSFTDEKDNYQLSTTPNISYRNLKPGTYYLKAYGKNNEYNFQTTTLSKTIIVKHKFYETWIFKLVMFGLLIAGIYAFMMIRLKQIRHKNQELLAIEREYAGIELQSLQSQLNPHFIFNCLGSIQALISEGNLTEANNYLAKFSRLMRKFLEHSSSHLIELQEEIEVNRLYLELEKLRFKEKMTFEIRVSNTITDLETPIPAVLIQPFVENAIRHGIFHKEGTGHILIDIDKKDDNLIFKIIDDGIGIEASTAINQRSEFYHESKGMNLLARKSELIQLVEKINLTIDIGNNMVNDEVCGTIVHITLPLS